MRINKEILENNKFIYGSPKFFNRPIEEVLKDRIKVELLLKLKGLDVNYYLEAFDYFVVHTEDFDGATIVKDLIDVVGLDLAALRHDYDYIYLLKQYKGLDQIKMNLIFDFHYGKNMERLGKGITTPYLRTVGLWLSTPFYYLIKLITKKKKKY